jgi:hypothetical protein
MRLSIWLSAIVGVALALPAPSAFAEAHGTINADPARMWECTQADGSSLYTNKELTGCKLMALKELSVVPSLDQMPTYRPMAATDSRHDLPGYVDRKSALRESQYVPDWAKQWHASVASSGSIQTDVCRLYGEWLNLTQKTRGGFFFGSDPSYGGDLSGQNQRGPSFSFYDNARYLTLAKVFGPGFVPIGCD